MYVYVCIHARTRAHAHDNESVGRLIRESTQRADATICLCQGLRVFRSLIVLAQIDAQGLMDS